MLLEGQTAYPLEPDLPARMWRAWMREPSMSFPAPQVERALSFFAAHLPRIDLRLRADGLDVVEDSQPVFLLTVEGSAEKARVQLGARYGTATVPVSPTAVHLGYAAAPGGQGRTLYRRQEAGRARRGAGADRARASSTTARGASTRPPATPRSAFWSSGLGTLPPDWERFLAKAPRVRMRRKLRPKVQGGRGQQRLVRARRALRVRGADGGPRRGPALAPHRPPLHPAAGRELRRGGPRRADPGGGPARGGRGAARQGADRAAAVPGRGAGRALRAGRGRPLRGPGADGHRRVQGAVAHPAGARSGGAHRHAPALPGGGTVLAVVPPPPRPRRHPRRRHGPGKDGAGAGAAPAVAQRRRRRAVPGGRADQRAPQLAARGRALHPRAPGRRLARPGPPRAGRGLWPAPTWS